MSVLLQTIGERLLNGVTPTKVQTRMQRHFGLTYVCFDALEGQADDWQDLLATVLSDPQSYVE